MPRDELTFHKDLVLDRIKHVARLPVGAQVIHDMELRQFKDWSLDTLVFELSTDVLAEKLLEDKQRVPFTATSRVDVEVPGPRHTLWPWVALSTVISALTFPLTSPWPMVLAWVIFAIAFIVYALNPPRKHKAQATVSGVVPVTLQHYHKFPHNDFAYPKHIGRPVIHQSMLTKPAMVKRVEVES